jgi:DNA invertase Pin-like site-specific DNA recombinase
LTTRSTEQNGVADDQKSVARQVEHARAYAERKGWTVDDQWIIVDDAVSGAEFANRPGFVRLLNALKPKPAFDVLVMSEESRLGREQIEVSYALKQLVTSGVRVFLWMTANGRSTHRSRRQCWRYRRCLTRWSVKKRANA